MGLIPGNFRIMAMTLDMDQIALPSLSTSVFHLVVAEKPLILKVIFVNLHKSVLNASEKNLILCQTSYIPFLAFSIPVMIT